MKTVMRKIYSVHIREYNKNKELIYECETYISSIPKIIRFISIREGVKGSTVKPYLTTNEAIKCYVNKSELGSITLFEVTTVLVN